MHLLRISLIAFALAALVLQAPWLLAQRKTGSSRSLDSNMQVYNMRSEFGHASDQNLRVGGSGYNVAGGFQRQAYTVNRAARQVRVGSASPSGFSAASSPSLAAARVQGARTQREFYVESRGMTRNAYNVSYASTGYRDAMIRSGNNPAANPMSPTQRAYSQPPAYSVLK